MVKSQRHWNLAFTAFMAMVFLTLLQVNGDLALFLALGIGLGYTLQKSRFCFAAAWRDPMITGITEITRAVLLLIGLSVAGFALVYGLSGAIGRPLELNVYSIGLSTLIGGCLFGIGMVLAGGCVTGVLMRVGEGFAMQMVALVGLILGALAGKSTQEFWQTQFGELPGVFLPDALGWIPALALQFGLLGGLWVFANRWQRKHAGG